jgi:UDP-glucose:(heptosyl)LPS alpha-1,3-glucosyltransferase
MRIAFMHRRLAGGGTEADLRRMASGLATRGHELHVFAAALDATVEGATLHRVPVARGNRLVRLVSFALMAPRLVARERWDVVVGFGRTTRQDVVRVGGGTHRSYLATMEAGGSRGRLRGPYHHALLWLERRMFSPTGHRRVLAVSRRVADEVSRDYGVPPDRVRIIYNGVDLARFHPARRPDEGVRVRRALGVGEARVCMAIGTGFERKGFDRLLATWRTHAPERTALVLVGDDERLGRYRREASDDVFAGRVHVLGPRPDVEALLGAADVVCLPSRQEAFGNVVLEAAAAGVPVVISRVVGAGELFVGSPAAAFVDDPDDARALGAAVEQMLAADGWGARSAAARALAERFPWSRHLDELETFLEEVRGGR